MIRDCIGVLKSKVNCSNQGSRSTWTVPDNCDHVTSFLLYANVLEKKQYGHLNMV